MEKIPRYLLCSSISISRLALFSLLLLSSLPGISSSRIVTLGSIEIFNTHEWLPSKPTVYFKCQGGNKTVLPDVKEKHGLYIFKGEESWQKLNKVSKTRKKQNQPLMVLSEKKCQRCGLYEADTIIHDDVFDEWEFCSSDFVDGRYVRFKEREFNATFICPECTASAGSNQTLIPNKDVEHKKLNVLLAVLITLLASILAAGVAYVVYRYWQKRKREQDQARFLKLFDDGDDIEVELGLGHI